MTTATALGTQAAVRFKDPTNRVISAGQWLEYTNQCYKKVLGASPLLPWNESAEETIAITSGNRIGSLPANVFQVNWVYDSTNDAILPDIQGRGEQWRSGMLRSDTGPPQAYRLRGATIELFPKPDSNITLIAECVEYPPALAGGDSPVYPANFHEDLIPGMLALAYLDDGSTEQYAVNAKEFDQKIAKFVSDMLMFRTQHNPPVHDNFFG